MIVVVLPVVQETNKVLNFKKKKKELSLAEHLQGARVTLELY